MVGADGGPVLHPGTREDPAHGAGHQAGQRADIVSIVPVLSEYCQYCLQIFTQVTCR